MSKSYKRFGIQIMQDEEGNIIFSDSWLNIQLHLPYHVLMSKSHEISRRTTVGNKIATFMGEHLKKRWQRAEKTIGKLDEADQRKYREIYSRGDLQALRIIEQELFLGTPHSHGKTKN